MFGLTSARKRKGPSYSRTWRMLCFEFYLQLVQGFKTEGFKRDKCFIFSVHSYSCLERCVVLHFYIYTTMPVPSLPKIDPVVLEKRKGKGFLKLLDVFSQLHLEYGVAFHLNKIESSPNNFWIRIFFQVGYVQYFSFCISPRKRIYNYFLSLKELVEDYLKYFKIEFQNMIYVSFSNIAIIIPQKNFPWLNEIGVTPLPRK